MDNSIAIHAKSIDFLLENAGPVIQYRLRKEILQDLTPAEEARLLEQIYQIPPFVLLQSYVKPDGCIGSGMHSWDNWRGQVLHETPLPDGSTIIPISRRRTISRMPTPWRCWPTRKAGGQKKTSG